MKDSFKISQNNFDMAQASIKLQAGAFGYSKGEGLLTNKIEGTWQC